MSQLTSILWKDTRELLPELVVSAAILGLFLLVERSGWASGPFTLLSASMLSRVVAVLVVVSWCVLIVRLVQAERLIGRNQFWTTRPYEWRKLFGAKAVFIALFIWLPLVCSHLYLLKCANLAILGNLHLLLINLGVVSIAFLLPFACVAALTGTFSRAVLVIVGVVVLITAALALGLSPRNFTPVNLLIFQILLLGLGLLSALLNQYRSRNTSRSNAIVLLTFGLVVLTQVLIPGSWLSVAGYKRNGVAGDLSIHLDSDPTRTTGKHLTDPAGKQVTLHLPLLVADPESVMTYLAMQQGSLTSADDDIWKSAWLSDGGLFSSSSQRDASATNADFSVSPSIYRRFGKGSVSVSLELFRLSFVTPRIISRAFSPLSLNGQA